MRPVVRMLIQQHEDTMAYRCNGELRSQIRGRTFILSGQDPPGLVINVKKVSTVEHSGDKLNREQVRVAVLLMRTFYSLTAVVVLISSEIWESSGFSGMHPITNDSRRASAAVLESLKRFALNFEQFQDNYQPLLRNLTFARGENRFFFSGFTTCNFHTHYAALKRSDGYTKRLGSGGWILENSNCCLTYWTRSSPTRSFSRGSKKPWPKI